MRSPLFKKRFERIGPKLNDRTRIGIRRANNRVLDFIASICVKILIAVCEQSLRQYVDCGSQN